MNCLSCELARAKLKVIALLLIGWNREAIAMHLSLCYGEHYFVVNNVVYRASKFPPHSPHLIG